MPLFLAYFKRPIKERSMKSAWADLASVSIMNCTPLNDAGAFHECSKSDFGSWSIAWRALAGKTIPGVDFIKVKRLHNSSLEALLKF